MGYFVFFIAWYFVGIAFMALFGVVILFFTNFVFAIPNGPVQQVAFILSTILGYGSALYVLRGMWPKSKPKVAD